MFKHILVPVDLTDTHARSLDIAAYLAGPDGEVTLLHVIELIAGLPEDEEKEFYERLEQNAREHLVHLGERLEERRIAWRSEVVFGNRVQVILRHAHEHDSDMIVLTSHRIDLEHPEAGGWGSLSNKLGILAQCPVLLVK